MKARSKSKVSRGGGIRRRSQDGLTMTEVCCALAALALLLMVALPALGMSKGRSHRIVCVNNLSRIGQATAMWANEHDGRRPMMTPYWEGGIQTSGILGTPPPGTPSFQWGAFNNQTWFHYFWLSNELVTPKVLLCPSDTGPYKRPAGDWSVSPTTGLLHSNFRGNSVSYSVAHSTSDYERSIINSDRNLPFTTPLVSCGYGYQGLRGISPTTQLLSWAGTPPLHYQEGNLLYNDGSVETADDVRLRVIFDAVTPSCTGLHYMVP